MKAPVPKTSLAWAQKLLTGIEADGDALLTETVALLRRRIAGESREPETRRVPVHLVLRATGVLTATPPAHLEQ